MTSLSSGSTALDDFVRDCRLEVEAALDAYLPRPPACPSIVAEAMRYSLEAGGKRFRPVLTLATADAAARAAHRGSGADREAADARRFALPAACAIELIHTYSLIHDDLPAMDNDTLRRGRPTLHVVYGDGLAILAGDGMLAEAFALLAREPRSDRDDVVRRKLRVIAAIGEAAGAGGMVGGQAIDLEAAATTGLPGRPRRALTGDELREMHARKTGALIRASACAGAIMAGAPDPVVAAIDDYAADLGLVFQIVDDILDVEGASQDLGKTAGKDAAADKPTYPALFGLERSRALAGEGVARAEATLASAGLADSLLPAIARWVASRRS